MRFNSSLSNFSRDLFLIAVLLLPFKIEVKSESSANTQVFSEGLSVIGVEEWHEKGLTGSGVKIAVVDLGFIGYRSLIGTELPSNEQIKIVDWIKVCPLGDTSCDSTFEGKTSHGSDVAEIVYDIAPQSNMYLVSINNLVDYSNALSYLRNQQVDIVVSAWTWPNDYCFVAGGYVSQLLGFERLRNDDGILIVHAAGNMAERHWEGFFVDNNQDNFHDFADAPRGLPIKLEAGFELKTILSWEDSCEQTSSAYSVALFDEAGEMLPKEQIRHFGSPWITQQFTFPNTDTYYLNIQQDELDEISDRRLKVFITSENHSFTDGFARTGSLPEPSMSQFVLTVGAVKWDTLALESSSSRGPTSDNRNKPELLAPTNVTLSDNLPFRGTSAATPHVAAAAALIKQACMSWEPDEIQAFMIQRSLLQSENAESAFDSAPILRLGSPLESCEDFGG